MGLTFESPRSDAKSSRASEGESEKAEAAGLSSEGLKGNLLSESAALDVGCGFCMRGARGALKCNAKPVFSTLVFLIVVLESPSVLSDWLVGNGLRIASSARDLSIARKLFPDEYEDFAPLKLYPPSLESDSFAARGFLPTSEPYEDRSGLISSAAGDLSKAGNSAARASIDSDEISTKASPNPALSNSSFLLAACADDDALVWIKLEVACGVFDRIEVKFRIGAFWKCSWV